MEKRSDDTSTLIGTNQSKVVTSDDILQYIGFGLYQVLACCLIWLTFFAYGTDTSIFIFVGIELQKEWNLSNIEYAALLAVTGIPNLIGASSFSFLGDNYGRVWPYAVSTLFMGVFGIACAFAPNFPVLVLLKCMTSVGLGGVRVLSIPYLMENLPVKNRAKASLLSSLAFAVGLCAAAGVAWWLLPTYPVKGWRYFLVAMAVPSILASGFRFVFYFESPRFYVARGKLHSAWKVFATMAKINGKALTDFASEEDFCTSLSSEGNGESYRAKLLSLRDLLVIFKPPYRRRTLAFAVILLTEELGYQGSALFLPQFLSQRQGVNIYFTLLAGFAAQIPGFLLMSIIVEWPRCGRLNALRLLSGMTLTFFVAIAFLQTAVTVSVLVVLIFFTMGPILAFVFVYISESYPTNIRTLSTASFYSIQAVFSVAWPFISGFAADVSQPWVYPLVWAGVYSVQLVAGLILNFEPRGQYLVDRYDP